MSPGQSFLVVSRTALANGRTSALVVAFGMGIGTVFWATGAIVGLTILFEQTAWLYLMLKLTAGFYLLFLAVMLWRNTEAPDAIQQSGGQSLSILAALRLGFITQIVNPKVAVFFGSIFIALLPANAPAWVVMAAIGIVFTNEIGWLAFVSCLFSVPVFRRSYTKVRPWLDRTTAALSAFIGGKLILEVQGSI